MAAGVDTGNVTSSGGPRARGTLVFGILMSLLFLGVAARLVQLQVMEHEERTREVAKMLYNTASERDQRGSIVDSKGIPLAVSVAARSCALDPKTLLEAEGARPEKMVSRLAEILELTPAQIEKLNKGIEARYVPKNSPDGEMQPLRFVWIKRLIDEEQWKKLRREMSDAKYQAKEAWSYRRRWQKLAGRYKVSRDTEKEKKCLDAAEGWRKVALDAEGRFAGVMFPPEFRRVYPQGQLAAHVLGFGDIDGRGLDGLEFICEPLLKGQTLKRMVARDARSRALSTMASDDRTTAGMRVELTLDSVIQAIVEEELQATVDEFKREYPEINAHAVVMEPFSGDILAIANYPTFDPNSPVVDSDGNRVDARNRRNDAVVATQEPGSTFKPLLIAASLEEKVATLQESVECATFRMNNGRRSIKDIYPYGRMTLEMALVKSSNPAMVRTGLKLGPEKMREYVVRFGFGEKTGSRLPGEGPGKITDARKWTEWTMGSVPMGYEIEVTTLQMAAAYSALANGGQLPRPNIVRSIYDANGGLALETQPEMRRRVISEATAKTMREVLRKVVTTGTGRRANIDEYPLGGKTGTANMIANAKERAAGMKGYSNKRHTANFVALCPWDKPRVVICVSIRDTGKFGGDGAGPTMGRIARRVLGYLGVPTANGEPIRADILPKTEFKPVPVVHIVGAEDDENQLADEIDPRWIDDWVEDEEAFG